MKKRLTFLSLLLVMAVLSACSSGEFKADHNYDIAPFAFTNQNNETVSLEDLKGHVWLAQFVFTNCTTVCQPMMMNMKQVEENLEKAGVDDYKIISFSVDPAKDSPEVLKDYLDGFDVLDPAKWEMLTGYKMKEIADLAAKSFKTIVAEIPDDDQVLHGTTFALVNQEGKVVKLYSGNIDVPFDDITKDVKSLVKSGE